MELNPLLEWQIKQRLVPPAERGEFKALTIDDNSCAVWLQYEEGGTDEDLELVLLGDHPEPYCPSDYKKNHIFNTEIEEAGIDSFIRGNWVLINQKEHGWGYCRSNAQAALELGLYPRQPFLIFISMNYYRCSYEYDEWDIDYCWDIVARLNDDLAIAEQRWRKWLQRAKRYITRTNKKLVEFNAKRESDTSAFYVRYDAFWSRGYDEMTPPDGKIILLCTRNTNTGTGKWAHHDLLRVRSDEFPRDTDLWKMFVQKVQARWPELTDEKISQMHKRW